MKHVEDKFSPAAGVELFWQAWVPAGDPKAVVVIAHGAGEHSARYAHVGAHLAQAGYATYALDHRGHGRSHGKGANIERMDLVVEDLDAFVVLAGGRHAGMKVFLLGHSMGGAISIAYALRHQDRLAGLLLSGPAAALDAATPVELFAGRVLSRIAPGLGVFGVDSSDVSRDPDVVRAYDEDPLVHHKKLPARTVGELAAHVEKFPDAVGRIEIPLLVMHGTDDKLTPPAGSRMVHERAGSADKTLELYEGLYHEILNEPEQGRVLADLTGWLDARAPAQAPAPAQ
jgi:alpha-beta hydrolase superfamily lysophospholipase